MVNSIFDKQTRLVPSTMAAVAECRYADAKALINTGQNDRMNGAVYLAGFVIEILLKAQLVAQYPTIAQKRQHDLLNHECEVWNLIWRQHQLDVMLNKVPGLKPSLRKMGERAGEPYLEILRGLCGTWTIYARYSSHTISKADATKIVQRVGKLKEVLKRNTS